MKEEMERNFFIISTISLIIIIIIVFQPDEIIFRAYRYREIG